MALFFTLLISFSVHAADAVHGVFRVVKGDVQIKSAKDGKQIKARLGEKIFPKDTIITGKDARAKIVMSDNNEINVSPESQMVIQNYVYEPDKGKKDVLLNVIYGKVRSKVEQKYDGQQTKFQVKTPSAVAGVRGTDFMASFNNSNGATQVVTFHGSVEFGTPGPGGSIQNPVMVQPGQVSTALAGQAPQVPTPMPKDQLAKADSETKAEDRSPSSQQNQGTQKGDSKSDKKEDSKESKDTKDSAKNEAKDSKGESKENAKSDSTTKSEGKSEGGTKSESGNSAGAANNGDSKQSSSGSNSGSSTGNASGNSGTAKSPSMGAAGATSPSGSTNTSTGAMPTMGREPSSMPTGSMIGADDLPASRNAPTFSAAPTFQAPVQPITQLPKCDFCNSVIQSGSKNITIKVQTN